MTEALTHRSFVIGGITVSPSHNQMSYQGCSVQVQPQVMAVLCYLANHSERVISSEELMDKLWHGRVVTQASVQKSMNSLRRGFAELDDTTEFVTHYSKRGYQLTLVPEWADTQSVQNDSKARSENPVASKSKKRLRSFTLVSLVALFTALVTVVVYTRHRPDALHKQHLTRFTGISGYTNETGHERAPEPHPDNLHVAYIRESAGQNAEFGIVSELVVRDASGQDWPVATAQGAWRDLAWSPDGAQLAAIEIKREEGLPLLPNYYEAPNYLYSFHFFSLDLGARQLLAKQQLSQWQGQIDSLSWWDDHTLEFVAQQGPRAPKRRYRYNTEEQQLLLPEAPMGLGPIQASAIHHGLTAIVSARDEGAQVAIFNQEFEPLARWQIPAGPISLSWVPDGTGVLVFAAEQEFLQVLYRDGSEATIEYPPTDSRVLSRPRYRADGQAIYIAQALHNVNIERHSPTSQTHLVTNNTNLNYAASFSSTGGKIAYASVRNHQTHLWLVEGNSEQQLTRNAVPERVTRIVWADNDNSVVFGAGHQIYRHDLATSITNTIATDTDKLEPLGLDDQQQHLWYLKTTAEATNLWQLHLKSQQSKQITFGAVGSAVYGSGKVYFQYVGKQGVWTVGPDAAEVRRITSQPSANARLLGADANGIYFLSGAQCRESSIQYLAFTSDAVSTIAHRAQQNLVTHSFHPEQGALVSRCELTESNILLLQ